MTLFRAGLDEDVEFFSDAGFDLDKLNLRRNAAVAQLYEDALMNEGAVLSAEGALIVRLVLTPTIEGIRLTSLVRFLELLGN